MLGQPRTPLIITEANFDERLGANYIGISRLQLKQEPT
jgi:hypothetical protein